MTTYRSVLITGASSGIGRALALELAAPGVTLHLSGRDAGRLDETASGCERRGAEARPRVLDVRDATAMEAWVAGAVRLDLVVANAGISAGTSGGQAGLFEPTREIFAVNLDGVLNTALPALRAMMEQDPDDAGCRGRIAVIASVAAFATTPMAAAYCAAKAAADAWTVATAHHAAKAGVQMTSICPGFVRSGITDLNTFPMPGLMDADRAARLILRGIAAGRRRVVFPWWIGVASRLAGQVPPALMSVILRRYAPSNGVRRATRNE